MDLNKILIEKALYPAMEKVKGNRVRTYCEELKHSQSASPDMIRKLQEDRLKKLLKACVNGVPAYRELDITLEEIEKDPFLVLQKVPVLRKKAFQADPDRYLNEAYDKTRMIANRTGGSTGEPLRFFMDRYAVEHYEAARWRGLSWWGISYGSRSVMIWGNPIELDSAQQRKVKFKDHVLKNRTVLSAYDLTEAKLDEYIGFLNRYQPEYIYGYATALYTFSRLLHEKRDQIKLKQLKAVVSTSETLHPYQRETMQSAFGCPVVNEYGARDAGILAYECPCGNLHITSENVILEVVDPVTFEPIPAGCSGVVVTTDLNNLAMPRLRYVLGDTATLSGNLCSCGVMLPMIESLDGREDAIFKLPDGTLVHGNFINQLSRKYKTIQQFQLVQTSVTHADLSVICMERAEEELQAFRTDIMEFMPGVEIAMQIVPEIPPSASGKIRYTYRKFDL